MLVGVVVGLTLAWGDEVPVEVGSSPMFMVLGGLRLDLGPLNELLGPAGYPPPPAWQPVMAFGERTPLGEGLLSLIHI